MVGVPALRPETFSRSFPKNHRARTRKTEAIKHSEGRTLHIYSDDLSRELVCHEVTWSRKDAWCEDQWSAAAQPEELPSQPVTTTVSRVAPPVADPAFARFDFGRAVM